MLHMTMLMMMMKVEAFFLGTWLKEGGMLRTLMRIRFHLLFYFQKHWVTL